MSGASAHGSACVRESGRSVLRRLLTIAATVLLAGGLSAPAFAAFAPGGPGPSGSTFSGNQVTCGHDNTFLDSPIVVYNDGRGAEVCSDSGPIQGRVIVAHYSTGLLKIDFVEIDSDADNPAPIPAGTLLFLPVGLP
jgi:hypothetical protein